MNIEDPLKVNDLDHLDKQGNDAVIFDSLNLKIKNPLNSQSLNKFQPFVDFTDLKKEDIIVENSKFVKQSFEDFRAKFLKSNL